MISFLLLSAVILLDLSLSGDNALVVASAANGLQESLRGRAIAIGMVFAAICRIGLALFVTTLLTFKWLGFVCGLLLFWVAYKLLQEILTKQEDPQILRSATSIWVAFVTIAAADLSMSVDNIVAVAAIARQHLLIMSIGIGLSILLLTVLTKSMSYFMHRWPELKIAGFILIVWIAMDLITGAYV